MIPDMKKFSSILAIAIAVISCAKQQETGCPSAASFTVNLEEGGTKVAIGEKSGTVYPISWETGDRLIVNGTVLTNPLDASFNGLKTATFTTPVATTYPATLVYPETVKGGSDYILVPAEQGYDPAHPGNGYGILTGYITTEGVASLNHASAYVKISLTGSATVKSVILSAPGAEMLAGRFGVDGETGALTHIPSPSDNIESSSCIAIVADKALGGSATDYMFAIPASQTYSKGLKLTVLDSEGKSMVKTMYSSTGKKFDAGVVYEPAAIAYVPGAAPEALFDVSETTLEFPGTGYAAKAVTITTLGEPVTVSKSDLLWANVEAPAEIPAYRTYSIKVSPLCGNPSDVRAGKLTFVGKGSAGKKDIAVSQSDLYTPVHGFPAKWFMRSTTFMTDGYPNEKAALWESEGICTPTNGGTAYVSATSADGTPLVYKVAVGSSTNTVGVGNLYTGDCMYWSVPVKTIAAGTDFDFMVTINSSSTATPKYWVFEWLDGDEWKCNEERLLTAKEDNSIKYSIYLTKQTEEQSYCTYVQPFKLEKAIESGFVKMRLRAVGNINSGGTALKRTSNAYIYLPQSSSWFACTLACYEGAPAIKDTKKVSAYGNSITFYNGSLFYLKELCRRGGHQLDMRINLKGSRECEHHANILVRSQEVTMEGGYDWTILQDGSNFNAQYGARDTDIYAATPKYSNEDILKFTKIFADQIKQYSPSTQLILESCYSYRQKKTGNIWLGFGSYENMDYYGWKGSLDLAAEVTSINWLAPIIKSFTRARNEYGFTAAYNYLEHTDNYHPNELGSYLKACTYYLIMFGDDFGPDSDCDLPASDAGKLRQAARDVVPDETTRQTFHIR